MPAPYSIESIKSTCPRIHFLSSLRVVLGIQTRIHFCKSGF
ncbi:hypothetical protein NYG90_05195 [Helicobacter sp. XJK30-2]|uniref:Uncharacterized protein n=1 Tax=Helicobacter zhangjianzhongii TaxID=2974574 RepID=A0ACC6FT25_9HELI|nr:hypothetical protein [Helicobacter sp. XJK30-2]MDL0079831.1 hypothetical protein [Helicobacter sp. CPD2-1]MDL0082073.1 hypothetical protein [Helicobacter sp. XJK30-2]